MSEKKAVDPVLHLIRSSFELWPTSAVKVCKWICGRLVPSIPCLVINKFIWIFIFRFCWRKIVFFFLDRKSSFELHFETIIKALNHDKLNKEKEKPILLSNKNCQGPFGPGTTGSVASPIFLRPTYLQKHFFVPQPTALVLQRLQQRPVKTKPGFSALCIPF